MAAHLADQGLSNQAHDALLSGAQAALKTTLPGVYNGISSYNRCHFDDIARIFRIFTVSILVCFPLAGTPEQSAFTNFMGLVKKDPRQALEVAVAATAKTCRDAKRPGYNHLTKSVGLPAWQHYAPPYHSLTEHGAAEQATVDPGPSLTENGWSAERH